MEKIAILGAGGQARCVLDLLLARNAVEPTCEVLGFIDDDPTAIGRELDGYPLLGTLDWLDGISPDSLRLLCGVGSPSSRMRMVAKASRKGFGFCSAIAPSAVLTPVFSMGRGVVVSALCHIANRAKLGDHVMVLSSCTIGHDVVVEDFCTISPGVRVSGNVQLGVGTEIGVGAVIIPNVRVGEWSIIGAGAVVVEDVPANVTVVGVPARVISRREQGWQDGSGGLDCLGL